MLQNGLGWMTKNFSVLKNPGTKKQAHYYYFMYAMERVGIFTGLEKLGKHWWYAEGAKELLARQKADGSWYGGADEVDAVIDTCFAILFLRRATRLLEGVSTGRRKK